MFGKHSAVDHNSPTTVWQRGHFGALSLINSSHIGHRVVGSILLPIALVNRSNPLTQVHHRIAAIAHPDTNSTNGATIPKHGVCIIAGRQNQDQLAVRAYSNMTRAETRKCGRHTVDGLSVGQIIVVNPRGSGSSQPLDRAFFTSPRKGIVGITTREHPVVLKGSPIGRTMDSREAYNSSKSTVTVVRVGAYGGRMICCVRHIVHHPTIAVGQRRYPSLGRRDRLRRHHRKILQWRPCKRHHTRTVFGGTRALPGWLLGRRLGRRDCQARRSDRLGHHHALAIPRHAERRESDRQIPADRISPERV